MPKIETTSEISASPEKIWSIIADPNYLPKLAPDIISSEADPPGLAVVGQKIHSVGKVGGRKVDMVTEVVEAERNELLTVRVRPGGIFKAGSGTVTIQPTRNGSRVTNANEYELSMGYLGKILNKLAVERTAKKNLGVVLRNLKEIAELKELPSQH